MERRDFLRRAVTGVAGVAAAAAVPFSVKAFENDNNKKSDTKMKKIIILNGAGKTEEARKLGASIGHKSPHGHLRGE